MLIKHHSRTLGTCQVSMMSRPDQSVIQFALYRMCPTYGRIDLIGDEPVC